MLGNPFVHFRGSIFSPILMKLGQNLGLDKTNIQTNFHEYPTENGYQYFFKIFSKAFFHRVVLTLPQTSPGFYLSAAEVF